MTIKITEKSENDGKANQNRNLMNDQCLQNNISSKIAMQKLKVADKTKLRKSRDDKSHSRRPSQTSLAKVSKPTPGYCAMMT